LNATLGAGRPQPIPGLKHEVWICATCGVEHADAEGTCAICADERQWVPAGGQRWTTLGELERAGHRVCVEELEADLFAITTQPKVGIGQHAHLVRTPAGNLLWDPVGFVDEEAAARVRSLGPVRAIAASHPHMFGAQVQWSRALDGAPVLVCEPDAAWVRRPDPVIELWRGCRQVVPGLTLQQIGGHFPGSAVVHWPAGADGRGVLLSSDTVQANPDRATVTFLRSYPNRIPLSPAVVTRIARSLGRLTFDRLYDNVGGVIDGRAQVALARSAERYCGWARGDFDALT